MNVLNPESSKSVVYFHFLLHRSTLSPRHTTISNYLSPASVDDARQSIAAVGQPLASNTGESHLDSPLSSGVTYANPTVYHNSPLLLQQPQHQPNDDDESDSPGGDEDPEEDRDYQEMRNSIEYYLYDEREV